VDRHDLQAAARRVQHFGEKLARACYAVLPVVGINRLQIDGNFCALHLDPAGQTAIDAVRHFGGRRLGESQAQQILWINLLFQQQPDHPGRKHLRFARPRRSAEPNIIARIDRSLL
jgi:hypothetical protein